MGFGFDVITRVESIERRHDGHEVKVAVSKNAMMPLVVQKLRARGRAMVAVGLVDVGSEIPRDIADAITDLDTSKIQRSTEIVREHPELSDTGKYIIAVHVNSS